MAQISVIVIFTAAFLVHLEEINCMKYAPDNPLPKPRRERECKGYEWFLRSVPKSSGSASRTTSRSPSQRAPMMTLHEYREIRWMLIELGDNDVCERFTCGFRIGNDNCVKAFKRFKTIPREYRGQCAAATEGRCYRLWLVGNQYGNQCSFYNPPSEPGSTGHWTPVGHCGHGMEERPNLQQIVPA